jgi:hypothetical protein
MLGENRFNKLLWQRMVRLSDGALVENATVNEWLTVREWHGLDADLANLHLLLSANRDEGTAAIAALERVGVDFGAAPAVLPTYLDQLADPLIARSTPDELERPLPDALRYLRGQ